MKIKIDEWRGVCENYLRRHAGISETGIKTLVDAALCADMRGVASHGTVRIPNYAQRIELGLINKTPNIKITSNSATLVHMDADNGLGQIAAEFAIEEAMKRAKAYGTCSVSIRNANHMGMLSYFALKAAQKNMISYIMCNTPPVVAPFGGMEPAIGTNPLCWAIPAEVFPIVMDMAISPARGKIRNAMAKGQPIPEGWALDKNGIPTTDASAAMEGCLLPIAGVKGYGMGIIVECFTGILSGAKYGKNVTQPFDDLKNTPDIGIYMMVLDIGQIIPVDEFKARVEDYIVMTKATKKSAGFSTIYVPGELEYYKEKQSREDGLEIDEKTYNTMMG